MLGAPRPPPIDAHGVRNRLLETFSSPRYRPPTLPAVAVDVLNLFHRPDVAVGTLTKVLEQDPLITAQVLRLAQSPVHAGRYKIASIQQAMVRLGLRTVRDLVVQVALDAKVFRCKPYAKVMERLQRHSVAVAHLCRIIGRYTSFETEFAFLCGLLHDIGISGALIALAERARGAPALPVAEVWPAVLSVHEQASSLMLRTWDLPPELSLVMAVHHQRPTDQPSPPLAGMVALANDVATGLGYGLNVDGKHGTPLTPEPRLEPAEREKLLTKLGLTNEHLDRIAADADAVSGLLAGS